ncbi:MAG TPA: glucose-1-phosphate adenylyltransferase subunit GlgD, partial [Spirochaetaceae bacterium]|nr:glucose-1-phosphate adenylyltransferase subunit GlgD [Spirochaetaceae bacterium]
FGSLLTRRSLATLPFGARYRMIDFPLSSLVNAGISTVGVIAPYYYRSLIDHLESGRSWNLDKREGGLFIMPGTVFGIKNPQARFLIGDLVRNSRIIRNYKTDYVVFMDTSCVMNADVSKVLEAHEKSGCQVTFVYKKGKLKDEIVNTVNFNVDAKGRVKEFLDSYDKTNNMFLGAFVVNCDFLMEMINGYNMFKNTDLIDLIKGSTDKISINAFEYKDYAERIDSAYDYYRVSMSLMDEPIADTNLFIDEKPIYTKVQDEVPCLYIGNAKVKNSIVASGCVIRGEVENSIIFRSVRIAEGSVVRNSIIMQHADIGRNVVLSDAILDKYVTIGEGKCLKGSPDSPTIVEKGTNI